LDLACPEVVLARELGIPFATIGLVTDYDCWKVGGAVDVPTVIARLGEDAKSIILNVVRRVQSRQVIRVEIEKAQKMARDAVVPPSKKPTLKITPFRYHTPFHPRPSVGTYDALYQRNVEVGREGFTYVPGLYQINFKKYGNGTELIFENTEQ
jgi:hypothetical protein